MEQNRWDALQDAGIDLPGALRRLAGNTELLEKFLMRFPEDDNFGMWLSLLVSHLKVREMAQRLA